MTNDIKLPAWFVVRAHSGAEGGIVDELQARGLDAYSPMEQRWKRTSNRRSVKRTSALIPGYLFARVDTAADFHAIKIVEGVQGLIGDGEGNPLPLPYEQIEPFKAAETLGQFDFTTSKRVDFRPGEPIRLVHGAFKGYVGQIAKAPSEKRVQILLSMFGRASTMTVPVDHLEPAE